MRLQRRHRRQAGGFGAQDPWPKAQPGEAAAFGQWLVAAARAAADAAKEGGFMGFGAQQVSEREEAMLNQVRAAVSG